MSPFEYTITIIIIIIIITTIIIIIMAVKRKDASLNKIFARRNRVAFNYHSLIFVKYRDSQIILKNPKKLW